ncbi:MAG: hypothetical protein WAQ98_20340 [Blastocatellia bacterium]
MDMVEVLIGQVWQNIKDQQKVIIKDLTNKIVVAQNLTSDSMFFDTIFNFTANYRLVDENYFTANAKA